MLVVTSLPGALRSLSVCLLLIFISMCMCVHLVHIVPLRVRRGSCVPWNWSCKLVVSHVGSGTWTWVLCKSSESFLLLSHFTSPNNVFVCLFWLVLIFEIGSHYVILAGLELSVDHAGLELTEIFWVLGLKTCAVTPGCFHFYLCAYVLCLYELYECMPHVYRCLWRPEEGFRDYQTWVLGTKFRSSERAANS